MKIQEFKVQKSRIQGRDAEKCPKEHSDLIIFVSSGALWMQTRKFVWKMRNKDLESGGAVRKTSTESR